MRNALSSTVTVVFGGILAVGLACGAPDEGARTANTNQAGAAAPATNAAAPAGNAAPAGSAEDAEMARAAALFKTNCARCHLESGTGDPNHRKNGIPNFTDAAWQKRESDAELIKVVTNGHGKIMPSFKDKLSPDEIALVVKYVRGFPERAGA
jgi:cbb3-type cytochrome c oxidase subunit III